MDTRKNEKIAAIIISVIIIVLSFFNIDDWKHVGIYSGCDLSSRLVYPFFHVNTLHTFFNAWCLLSVMFMYDVSILRLVTAYIIAVTIPTDIHWFSTFFVHPTVGLSGILYILFGSISFDVVRRAYYHTWMAVYISIGFCFPNTNGMIHLYCYLCGFIIALLNKPFIIRK